MDNSQFALLALYEAERVGVDVDDRTWRLALRYWLESQRNGESWNYSEGAASTGSMTCAGLSSLIICAKNLLKGDAWVNNGQVICCMRQEPIESLERGFGWLGRNFSVRSNPAGGNKNNMNWYHYYMYGLERVGRLGGQRFIGDHDWYREGVEALLERWGRWVAHRPLQVLALVLVASVLLIANVRHLEFDNSIEGFLLEDDAEVDVLIAVAHRPSFPPSGTASPTGTPGGPPAGQ